jgi:hypothetical protein
MLKENGPWQSLKYLSKSTGQNVSIKSAYIVFFYKNAKKSAKGPTDLDITNSEPIQTSFFLEIPKKNKTLFKNLPLCFMVD